MTTRKRCRESTEATASRRVGSAVVSEKRARPLGFLPMSPLSPLKMRIVYSLRVCSNDGEHSSSPVGCAPIKSWTRWTQARRATIFQLDLEPAARGLRAPSGGLRTRRPASPTPDGLPRGRPRCRDARAGYAGDGRLRPSTVIGRPVKTIVMTAMQGSVGTLFTDRQRWRLQCPGEDEGFVDILVPPTRVRCGATIEGG